MNIAEIDRQHVWHHLSQHAIYDHKQPPVMVKGEGLKVWDINGKEYLDASAGGVWTVNVGYGRCSIAEAVKQQLETLNFFAATAGTPVAAEFSRKLLEKMPGMSRVYLSNSGSEANEKAYKMVRQIAHKKYNGKKTQNSVQRTGLSRHNHYLPQFNRTGRATLTVRPFYSRFLSKFLIAANTGVSMAISQTTASARQRRWKRSF